MINNVKCQKDKIKNDDNKITYQIYYYHESEDDWRLEVPFKLSNEQKKKHFETTDDLEKAIKLIISYGCVLYDFVTIEFK